MKQLNCAWFRLVLRAMGVRYGKNLVLYGVPAIFPGGGRIVLGENVHINSNFLSNLLGVNHRTIIVTRRETAEITIGNRVGISGATLYARKRIVIGDDTNIGVNVKIMDNDFHPVNPAHRCPERSDMVGVKEVVIGRNCFIGCNALILKGVHIGDNTTIGAGSVVTRDIPANCVAAGNPAVVIKNFTAQ